MYGNRCRRGVCGLASGGTRKGLRLAADRRRRGRRYSALACRETLGAARSRLGCGGEAIGRRDERRKHRRGLFTDKPIGRNILLIAPLVACACVARLRARCHRRWLGLIVARRCRCWRCTTCSRPIIRCAATIRCGAGALAVRGAAALSARLYRRERPRRPAVQPSTSARWSTPAPRPPRMRTRSAPSSTSIRANMSGSPIRWRRARRRRSTAG